MKLHIYIIMAILLTKSTFAYLDPSTGGIILRTLWPLFVAALSTIVAVILRYFWHPIKRTIVRVFRKKEDSTNSFEM